MLILIIDAQHIPNNSSSFKKKSSLIADRNGVKIAVPLKYVYRNSYKVIAEKSYDPIKKLIDSSCQGINRLFIRVMIIEIQSILIEHTFFQEWKLKITTLTLMKEIFMINLLIIKKQMNSLNSMMS